MGINPLRSNIIRDDNNNRLLVGYGGIKGNEIMPYLERFPNNDFGSYPSSRPTAALSGKLGGYYSIIMGNYPGTTLAGANTILKENYKFPKIFEYKDEDGTIKEGFTGYYTDGDKFIDVEILHKPEIEALQLNQNDVQLPSGRGLCYVGKGIQFEYNGRRYDATNKNRSQFMNIIANNDIKCFWNKDAWRKYGGKGDAKFDVYVVDTHGRKVPDVQIKNVTKSVSNNGAKGTIHLAEVADVDRNMIAYIPSEIASEQKFLLGDHINGPLKSYAEVYQKPKGRVPYKDAEKSIDILDLQVRLNSSLVADGHMNGLISSLNPKGEIIKKQKIDSLVIYPNIKIAQTPSVRKSSNIAQTSPNKSYKSSIYDTFSKSGKKSFDKGIAYVRNNNIPKNHQTPRTQ